MACAAQAAAKLAAARLARSVSGLRGAEAPRLRALALFYAAGIACVVCLHWWAVTRLEGALAPRSSGARADQGAAQLLDVDPDCATVQRVAIVGERHTGEGCCRLGAGHGRACPAASAARPGPAAAVWGRPLCCCCCAHPTAVRPPAHPRCSGTNLAEHLLRQNLDASIEVRAGLTAHKHWMQPPPNASAACGTLILLTVRNPWDWARALYRVCYCCKVVGWGCGRPPGRVQRWRTC